MKFIYTNHSSPEDKKPNNLPRGICFEYEAEDILIADKAFFAKYGVKMSDEAAAFITTRIAN